MLEASGCLEEERVDQCAGLFATTIETAQAGPAIAVEARGQLQAVRAGFSVRPYR